MDMLANGEANGSVLIRGGVIERFIVCGTLMILLRRSSQPWRRLKTKCERFVTAQNVHERSLRARWLGHASLTLHPNRLQRPPRLPDQCVLVSCHFSRSILASS